MPASVIDQIRKLDEQKAQLIETAKQEALDRATKAIEELNELGFPYELVEGGGVGVGNKPAAQRATRTPSGSGRRTGIRESVLSLIKESDGVARADIIETLGGKGDKSLEQSVSNALSALKKAGTIDAENGVYKSK